MDKWLWAVRLFKSRSQAAAACAAGHVKVGGLNVKSSRDVHIGDVIRVRTGPMEHTVRVRTLIGQRVGANVLADVLEDLTPAAEYERARAQSSPATPQYPKGRGRPTKRDRRMLERIIA